MRNEDFMCLTVNKIFALTLMLFLLPILLFILDCNIVFVAVVYIWCYLALYSYKEIEKRGMLFAFLVTFFCFLMGREILEQFFIYKVEAFDDNTNRHAYISMLLSLLSVGLGYMFFSQKKQESKGLIRNDGNSIRLRLISKIVYYFTIIFAIITKLVIARYVFSHGYTEYYVSFYENMASNGILYVISKIEIAMPVALCVFLSTLPTKKELRQPIWVYLFYLLVSLGSGQRSTLMLGLLFLMVYFLYRQSIDPDTLWVKRKWICGSIFVVPFLALFFSWFNAWRFNETDNNFVWYAGLFDFFYAQGVTVNIIKHAYNLYEELANQQFYILEFAKSGFLARLFNIEVYNGNSIEHALYGGSFTHALGYKVLGNLYLMGRGTGTSYIAELFQDFSYFGIVLGNILYAYLLANINRFSEYKSIFMHSLQLLMITQLLWAPRGSFSGFLSVIFFPSTIITLIIIFGLNYLISIGTRGSR